MDPDRLYRSREITESINFSTAASGLAEPVIFRPMANQKMSPPTRATKSTETALTVRILGSRDFGLFSST